MQTGTLLSALAVLLALCAAGGFSLPVLPVAVEMDLVDVSAINDFGSFFEAEFELILTWSDPNATRGQGAGDVFIPSVVYSNVIKREVVWLPSVLVQDGAVQWRQRERSKFAFQFDLDSFPFDSQDPRIVVEPQENTQRHVVLFSNQDPDTLLDNEEFFHLEGWSDYHNTEIVPHVRRSGRDGRVDGIEFKFEVKRDVGSYITQNIVPSIAFVCIAWAGFFIDYNALMPRLMPILFATVALSNTNASTSRLIPRASDVTWFEAFALASTIATAFVLLELIIVHNFARHGFHDAAKFVDMASRFVFPLLYLTLFLILLLLLGVRIPIWGGMIFLVGALLIIIALIGLFIAYRAWAMSRRKAKE
eukprot:TRINITY_DN2724_c1_g1_i2.p1 TRINITY_DN2724_c1_g1~~TRINITY_DN2724_c1_g1_i2.p1  ORF type:complete len:362 (-),score=126.96 TRINITY_DN2724_c1_g1_i2:9-1094(-)